MQFYSSCMSFSLEKANIRLLEELRQAEMEYNTLQEEVRVLNSRLINFRNEHVLELGMKVFILLSFPQYTIWDFILHQPELNSNRL